MTQLDDGTIATDLNSEDNARLTREGYTIRHIEEWLASGVTCIIWDAPQITERDCPF
jgi:hypothetical protein